jgi:hypothetical protein
VRPSRRWGREKSTAGHGGVKPGTYDPTLNPVYRDMLNHYRVTLILALRLLPAAPRDEHPNRSRHSEGSSIVRRRSLSTTAIGDRLLGSGVERRLFASARSASPRLTRRAGDHGGTSLVYSMLGHRLGGTVPLLGASWPLLGHVSLRWVVRDPYCGGGWNCMGRHAMRPGGQRHG